jgi:hypothetical protein
MNKSSVHFENIKPTSQSHNLRLREFDYVRQDLTPSNKSYGDMQPHPKIIDDLKTIIKNKTGRTAQARAKFLIEGVFLFTEQHSNNDLFNVAKEFRKKFDVVVLELHIHRDEGHYEKLSKEWKPNLHAHIIFENIDRATGKSVKWNKEDLSNIQDFFAESLNMQRGLKSDKKHLNAIQYKIKKEQERLQNLIKEQDNLKIKETLILQAKIFSDFYMKELDLSMKMKYVEYVAQHPLGKEFNQKCAEQAVRAKNLQANKKRLY